MDSLGRHRRMRPRASRRLSEGAARCLTGGPLRGHWRSDWRPPVRPPQRNSTENNHGRSSAGTCRSSVRVGRRNGANVGFGAFGRDYAGERTWLGPVGWSLRGEGACSHWYSSSRRATDDRVRLGRRLPDPLGRARGMRCRGKSGGFHSCPCVFASHGNQPLRIPGISLGRRAKHSYANRGKLAGHRMAARVSGFVSTRAMMHGA